MSEPNPKTFPTVSESLASQIVCRASLSQRIGHSHGNHDCERNRDGGSRRNAEKGIYLQTYTPTVTKTASVSRRFFQLEKTALPLP